jgi:hypothetical protein
MDVYKHPGPFFEPESGHGREWNASCEECTTVVLSLASHYPHQLNETAVTSATWTGEITHSIPWETPSVLRGPTHRYQV